MNINFLKYFVAKAISKIQISAIKSSYIDPTSRICSNSNVVNSRLERYSYIGNYCLVAHTNIGKFCSIGDHTYIGGASHPINWMSTSPIFHTKLNTLQKTFSTTDFNCYTKTIIGNDVWIGANCNIKGGITIGNGSVIGMGSVVTKNVGDYEIWAGNPAKLIRKRFDSDVVSLMLNSNWWDLSDDTLINLSNYYSDPYNFLNEINKLTK